MSKCYLNVLEYVFDVEGHTIPVCKAPRGNYQGTGRKVCSHFNGKCPAIVYMKENK